MADPKKTGAFLLAALKPKAPAESDAGDSPRRMAAQGVLEAIEAKDAAALEDALATFLDAGKPDSIPPPAA